MREIQNKFRNTSKKVEKDFRAQGKHLVNKYERHPYDDPSEESFQKSFSRISII